MIELISWTSLQQTCLIFHFHNFHLRCDVFFLLFGFELYVIHNKISGYRL